MDMIDGQYVDVPGQIVTWASSKAQTILQEWQ